MRIDLNCDVGEGFGIYACGHDAEILRYVTSANIACGFHAGDPTTIRKTVDLALEHGVAIGAHPGLPDLLGFGRRAMQISAQEAHDLVLYQLGALEAFVKAAGGRMSHMKPHGALYHMAGSDSELATAVATAVLRFDSSLSLVGASGSALIRAGTQVGLKTAREAFADRVYLASGSLAPRTASGALLTDPDKAADQALQIVLGNQVRSLEGATVDIQADTLCIHSDTPNAVASAQAIHARLKSAGVDIKCRI